jgi:NADH:ubiquinone oxidoreductase subunit F (NADH-binding)
MTSTVSGRYAVAAPAANHPYRLLRAWYDTGRPTGLADHLGQHGPLPLDAYPGESGRRRLRETVDRSGLRGRGGAGFPTGRKLLAITAGRLRPVVLANGCEGDPASGKDRTLLTLTPHLVLDGVALAAHAVAATEAVLCVHRGDPLEATLRAAVRERPEDPVPVRVEAVPARYVSSEESALVNFLNTGEARPTSKPPRPFERGVQGRPTLVSNVETYAHLALIARHGAEWFRGQGTADSAGTALVTVGGAVSNPGVYEVGLGIPLGQVLHLAGPTPVPRQAVLVGGYGGSWLGLPAAEGVPLTHHDLRAAGASLGIASLVALPVSACGIAETARIVRHLADESARQCGPCMFGLPALAEDLTALAAGVAGGDVRRRLDRRLAAVAGRGACSHPDGAVRLATSALWVFSRDVHAHLQGRPCRFTTAPAAVPAASRHGGWR